MKHYVIPRMKINKLLSLTIICMIQLTLSAQHIPYPDALNKAAILQDSLPHVNTNSMVIGNGDINALIFSNKDNLVMNLAKNDVWDARLLTENDPPLLKVDVKNHSWMGGGIPASWSNPYPTQTPPAIIIIESVGKLKKTKVDLKLGLASIKTSLGESTIRALSQDNVFYIESDKKVIIQGFPQSFLPEAEKSQTEGLTIIKQHLPGDLDYKGMDVFTVLKSKGNKHAVAIVTTRESANALTDAIQLVNGVLEQESKTIIKEHEKGWQQFWSKSGVQLADSDFQNWWYRQLYYFRCLSRPGAYPIALQGGYNKRAPWHGTWTMNYNAQQTFWSAFNTNHVELAEPFIDLVHDYIPRARYHAKTVFDAEGGVTPHNFWPFEPDPEESVSVNKRQLAYMPWSYGIGTAGHIAHNLWLHYLYNGDVEYLREKIYPVIKDYALFYASFIDKCKEDNNGKVIFGPSLDPEHSPFGFDNSPYDIAWAQHTLKAAIKGANDLGVDPDLVKRWTESLDRLPYYPIVGDHIQAGEKTKDYNIITPVVPMFPAEQVSWFSPQREKDLFKRTIKWIESRYVRNNSVVMINVARARMSMTDDAITDTKKWFKSKELPNGLFYWHAHGFYMSEQIAVSGLITEFLLQSNGNIVRIFPAWPEDKNASFSDLRARGGFLVSAKQKSGTISNFTVESTIGGELKLVSPWSSIGVKYPDGRKVSLTQDSLGVVKVNTTKGEKLVFFKESD